MLYDRCFSIPILVTNALVQEKTLEKPSAGEDKSDAPQEKLAFKDDAKSISPSVLKSFYKYERRDIEMQSGPDKTSPRKVNTEEFWNQELLKSFSNPGKPEEIDFDKATRHLHKMVRHWLGLRQDCEDLLAQLKFLQETYKEIKRKETKIGSVMEELTREKSSMCLSLSVISASDGHKSIMIGRTFALTW